MQRPFFEGRFYQTYDFANAIANILRDQFEYLRDLDGFYGDDKYLTFVRPFQKYSAFHYFIEFVIDIIINDEIDNINWLFGIKWGWGHIRPEYVSGNGRSW